VVSVRVAAVQMTATTDRDANLATADRLFDEATRAGATFVVLPELFSLLGPAAVMRSGAEGLDGPTATWAADAARRAGVWLLAGSITERVDGMDRSHNTALLVDPEGRLVATYRKIHLFDNDVAGAAFRESETVAPGDEPVTADIEVEGTAVRLGLTTCYDLRFPELFRVLALQGAEVVVLPSAFTAVTGAAHWEPLVRARAIENQVFVVAAGQWGATGTGITCHGHSMIVDPWGVVLAEQDDGDGVVLADLDLTRLAEVRAQLPSLANRRPHTYRGLDT
jgi:deaminated glutathione amidase